MGCPSLSKEANLQPMSQYTSVSMLHDLFVSSNVELKKKSICHLVQSKANFSQNIHIFIIILFLLIFTTLLPPSLAPSCWHILGTGLQKPSIDLGLILVHPAHHCPQMPSPYGTSRSSSSTTFVFANLISDRWTLSYSCPTHFFSHASTHPLVSWDNSCLDSQFLNKYDSKVRSCGFKLGAIGMRGVSGF